MKYLFLVFGIVIGLFWSQIYGFVGLLVNQNLVMEQGAPEKDNKVAEKRVQMTRAMEKPREEYREQPRQEKVRAEKVSDSAPVMMYATKWCGYCKKAREYFVKHKINFIEYDIERDESAKGMYEMLGGSGVPLIVYNGKKLQGFSERGFMGIYR